MELYIKQAVIPGNTLFVIQEPSGRLLYRLWGNPESLRGVYSLLDDTGAEKARILRVGTAEVGVYEIRLYQGEKMRVICQKALHHGSILFQGKSWHMRGSLQERSFDIVQKGHVLMTHEPCWQGEGGFCYGITLKGSEAERLFCLCTAMIVDGAPMQSGRCMVPV